MDDLWLYQRYLTWGRFTSCFSLYLSASNCVTKMKRIAGVLAFMTIPVVKEIFESFRQIRTWKILWKGKHWAFRLIRQYLNYWITTESGVWNLNVLLLGMYHKGLLAFPLLSSILWPHSRWVSVYTSVFSKYMGFCLKDLRSSLASRTIYPISLLECTLEIMEAKVLHMMVMQFVWWKILKSRGWIFSNMY